MFTYPTYADPLIEAHRADAQRVEARLNAEALLERWFEPLPWQSAALDDESFIVVLTGAAGGGKSVCAAQMLHDYMMRNPGSVGAAGRFHRANARKSCAIALQKCQQGVGVKYNKTEGIFDYPNGSRIYLFGVKDESQLQAIRSINGDGSLDIAWFEEANAFPEDALDEFFGRLRAKNGPYRQLILSTNPDIPTHWIKLRLIDSGEASVHISSYLDNIHNPESYKKAMAAMSGVKRKRLVEGIWASSDGLTYPAFGMHNISDDAVYDPDTDVLVWGFDDGYTGEIDPRTGRYTAASHPRVFLFGAVTPTGVLKIIDEMYSVETVAREDVRRANERYPYPYYAAGENSKEMTLEMQALGIQTMSKPSRVEQSVSSLNGSLGLDENGVTNILINPNTCANLIFEMGVNKLLPTGKPEKINDHGLDALRYLDWRVRRN